MGKVVITIEFEEGTTVGVSTSDGEEMFTPEPAIASGPVETVRSRTPSTRLSFVNSFIEGVVAEGCTIATPVSSKGGFTDSWAIMLPPRCRRKAKAGAVNYNSTRVAAFAGRPDLRALGFRIAEETYNKGDYAYPKIPRLDSEAAATEAVDLIKLAIKHFGG